MRKKELLISTDDIAAVEEAVHLSDSRRAGESKSIAEWNGPHAQKQYQADALRHGSLLTAQRSGQDLSSKSPSSSPDTLWRLLEPRAGGGTVQTELNSVPKVPKCFLSHPGDSAATSLMPP